MAIQVSCNCGHEFRVAREHAGKRIRCKSCREPVRVPEKQDGQRRKNRRQTSQPDAARKVVRARKRGTKRGSRGKIQKPAWAANPRIQNAVLWTCGAIVVGCSIAVGSDKVVLGLPSIVYYLFAVIAGVAMGFFLDDGYEVVGMITGPIMAIGVVTTVSFLETNVDGRVPRSLRFIGLLAGGLPGYGLYLLGKKIQDSSSG